MGLWVATSQHLISVGLRCRLLEFQRKAGCVCRDFQALLPRLLRKDGVYSYFNGLAADNAFFHTVYCRLVQMELARLGLSTEFVPLPISVTDAKIWEGVRNRYFQLETYLLPVCALHCSD